MKQFRPNLIVMVVYKTKDSTWRGFCSPYDVSLERETRAKAIKDLRDSVKLYEEGIKKYSYPRHLSLLELSNGQDRKVFDLIRRKVASVVEEEIREKFLEYQEPKEEKVSLQNPTATGYYYHPAAYC